MGTYTYTLPADDTSAIVTVKIVSFILVSLSIVFVIPLALTLRLPSVWISIELSSTVTPRPLESEIPLFNCSCIADPETLLDVVIVLRLLSLMLPANMASVIPLALTLRLPSVWISIELSSTVTPKSVESEIPLFNCSCIVDSETLFDVVIVLRIVTYATC